MGRGLWFLGFAFLGCVFEGWLETLRILEEGEELRSDGVAYRRWIADSIRKLDTVCAYYFYPRGWKFCIDIYQPLIVLNLITTLLYRVDICLNFRIVFV